MNRWIRLGVFGIALYFYFVVILKSDDIVSAIVKISVVALLLFGMEAIRRDKEKVFIMHSDMGQLKVMEADQFIEYVANLYKKLGYYIDLIKTNQELGCDIIARKNQDVICIRCIGKDKIVDLLPLQEVFGSKNMYKANKCMVITPSYYTDKAKQFAKANHVKLVDQIELGRLIGEVTNKKKWSITSRSTQKA